VIWVHPNYGNFGRKLSLHGICTNVHIRGTKVPGSFFAPSRFLRLTSEGFGRDAQIYGPDIRGNIDSFGMKIKAQRFWVLTASMKITKSKTSKHFAGDQQTTDHQVSLEHLGTWRLAFGIYIYIPRCEPWCWNISFYIYTIFMTQWCKYSSTMVRISTHINEASRDRGTMALGAPKAQRCINGPRYSWGYFSPVTRNNCLYIIG
jgi:hypothetical protein